MKPSKELIDAICDFVDNEEFEHLFAKENFKESQEDFKKWRHKRLTEIIESHSN